MTAATGVSAAAGGCASATMTGDGSGGRRRSPDRAGNVSHGTVIAGQPRPSPWIDHHVGRDLHIVPAATPIDGFVGGLLSGLLHQLFRQAFQRDFSTGLSAGFSACAAMRDGDSAGGGAGVGGAVSSMALGAAAAVTSRVSDHRGGGAGTATIVLLGSRDHRDLRHQSGLRRHFQLRDPFHLRRFGDLAAGVRLPAAPLPPPPCTMYPVAAVAPSMP